ncbi:MAG: hypothetical protein U0136_20905 [Bdellovibrionota bacterium]
MTSVQELRFHCEVLLIYNCAAVVDIPAARQALRSAANRVPWRLLPDSSYHGMFDQQPIRVEDVSEPFTIDSFQTDRSVEMTLWATGMLTIKYTCRLPKDSSLAEVQHLSNGLSTSSLLSIDSKQRALRVVELLRCAMQVPDVREECEDYLIFVAEGVGSGGDFLAKHRAELATLLRGQDLSNPLTESGVDDALGYSYSPRQNTLVVADWAAAFVCGPKSGNERELLEFVQMQLLELRYLLSVLTNELDEAYDLFDRLQLDRERWRASRWRWLHLVGRPVVETLRQVGVLSHEEGNVDDQLFRLGMLVVDVQECVEKVSLPMNFIGDPTLFTLYNLAKKRFELDRLGATVAEKLHNLNQINEKLTERHHTTKGHFWELVVVILITIEVIKSFMSH